MSNQVSIQKRLITVLFGAMVLISLVFITTSVLLTRDINEQKDFESAKKTSGLIIKVFQLKFHTGQTLAEDYSYWDTLYDLVKAGETAHTTYSPLMGSLTDEHFTRITLYDKQKNVLYSKDTNLLIEDVDLDTRQFDNLKEYGDVVHQVKSQGNRFFVISTRGIYSSSDQQEAAGFLTTWNTIDNEFLAQIEAVVGSEFQLLYKREESLPTLTTAWDLETRFVKSQNNGDTTEYTFGVYDGEKRTAFNIILKEDVSQDSFFDRVPILTIQVTLIVFLVMIVYFLLRAYVTKPIIDMNLWVNDLSSGKDASFDYPFNDELKSLANSINTGHARQNDLNDFNNALLEAISDVIVTTDSNLIIDYCNPAAQAFFEREHTELINQPLDFLIKTTEGDSVAYWVNSVFKSGDVYSAQNRVALNTQSNTKLAAEVEVTVKLINHGESAVVIIKV